MKDELWMRCSHWRSRSTRLDDLDLFTKVGFSEKFMRTGQGPMLTKDIKGGFLPKSLSGHIIEMTPEIFARFKLLMAYRGMNQSQFAKVVGLSAGYISDLKAGRGNISKPVFDLICYRMGCREEWLLTGNGPQPYNSDIVANRLNNRNRFQPGIDKIGENDWLHSILYESRLTSGPGSFVKTRTEEDEGCPGTCFKRKWIEKLVPAGNFASFRVSGEWMTPTIQEGDNILVDMDKNILNEIQEGKIYTFSESKWIKVKRLYRKGDELWSSCDNKEFQDDPIDLNIFSLIGKVVWVGHVLK